MGQSLLDSELEDARNAYNQLLPTDVFTPDQQRLVSGQLDKAEACARCHDREGAFAALEKVQEVLHLVRDFS